MRRGNDAFDRSIMCMHDGKLLGGNSAFADLGGYVERDGEIIAEVITERHRHRRQRRETKATANTRTG
ncbi:hypothetical protein FXB41_41210 [Bradyrhizobium canariense]|nr:hypothetical protein [Bradyrhizobium canariense]